MSRANRQRAMECVAGPGSWLAPSEKLALLLIGDLVKDPDDEYWEAQARLAQRMGVSRRTAGRVVRRLATCGVLASVGWRRVDRGATLKVFRYTPENLTAKAKNALPLEVGRTVPAEVGEWFPLRDADREVEVGTTASRGGSNRDPRWEETTTGVGSDVPQTGMNHYELIANPDKLAAPPPTPTTLEDPIALEDERQRQRLALAEMAHANG